jgi:hypothetical protein
LDESGDRMVLPVQRRIADDDPSVRRENAADHSHD